MKNILVLILLIQGFTTLAPASPIDPNHHPTQPVALYTEKGPYDNGAPYSLVAHGHGNDNFHHLKSIQDYWIIDDLKLTELFSLGKFENKGGLKGENKESTNTFSAGLNQAAHTGTWRYESGELKDSLADNDFQLYFSIKAGPAWNLFSMNTHWNINDAVTFSTLDSFFTTDLDNLGPKDISHISFWKGSPVSAVPEPATAILLGLGLMGLAGVGRQTKKE